MAATVGDFLVERLHQWGVRRIFGYPGDGINGIMGALGRVADDFDFVRVRHEEMSAFMASAHAKFTGEVGVCLATSGPGALHLLAGLYDAKMDHAPVLAIVGQQPSSALGSDFQQEVDLQAVFHDLADYVQTIVEPSQARHVVDRALRIAAAERTVTCIVIPNNVQLEPAVPHPPRKHGHNFSSVGYARANSLPLQSELQRAADLLNAGERVAILAGAGALHATDELIETCEILGAGVAKALLGKAALPDELPFVTGGIGLLGTRASWYLMQHCDTLLLVGTTFPYAEFLPPEGRARAVQIDIEPRNVGMRYPTEVNLIGDSAATLRALLPLLVRKQSRSWQQQIAGQVGKWWKDLETRAMKSAEPINPQRVFWELSPRLPDDVILCGDSGSSANWYACDLKMRRGMKASLSGKLASMGSGVPYAIAAKMAFPERPVIAVVGDGAMQMNGNAELLTVKQYWRRWENPCFIVLVLVNHDLNMVTWEQRVLAGDPKFPAAQEVVDFPYAQYGGMLGLKGIRVDKAADIAAAWDLALAADRPVVIEFVTDPNVPPLPPHLTSEQALDYLRALIKVDPDQWQIIKQSAKQLLPF
ncbi:MAG: thiamine pyrophosphate-requiring protein [Gammaproteobacteria bacterium]|nr:thiamine pyrophosphate-requiring protein [Gammaproteobacteria bacterium]